jgi:hypothetical protein
MSLRFPIPSSLALIVAIGGISLAVGCGSADFADVSGQIVRNDGTPVVGAQVTARSAESGKWASGMTNQEGRYSLSRSADERGVVPGTYDMIIVEDRGDVDAPKKQTIPKKYGDAATSGLSISAKAGDSIVFDVKLDAG